MHFFTAFVSSRSGVGNEKEEYKITISWVPQPDNVDENPNPNVCEQLSKNVISNVNLWNIMKICERWLIKWNWIGYDLRKTGLNWN